MEGAWYGIPCRQKGVDRVVYMAPRVTVLGTGLPASLALWPRWRNKNPPRHSGGGLELALCSRFLAVETLRTRSREYPQDIAIHVKGGFHRVLQ